MNITTLILGQQIKVPLGYRALVLRDGSVDRTLTPGRHRLRPSATFVFVDMRDRVMTTAPQEITTAEAVTVRVTLALRVRVTDPLAYVEVAENPDASLYLAAQIALREAVVGVTIEELLARTSAFDVAPVRAAVAAAASTVGVEMLDVVVKDIVVPHEIRSAAIELMTAKSRGAAKLEEARAETAALRALANAGKMLDASPALAQLRLIQAAPYGSKIVLAVGAEDHGE
ncbi:slipin family protein [Gordonia sp. TBRC 11910]|uniref:Slipin family protein n=1 Tax=Gordonia asplenii TaxID=2725283 RepID=A0A848KWK3_9ACTN|nr:slipin family protein [Gordonia asplenii]NMO02447.1 slipin family protein [Gordonia asplenii]